jgi:hypothetical protein
MNHARLSAAALAILAALGLLALNATAGQAADEYLLLHPVTKTFAAEGLAKALDEAGVSPATFAGTFASTARFIVPTMSAEASCTSGHVEEGKAYGTVLHLTFKFLGCHAYNIQNVAHTYPLLEAEKELPCTIPNGTIELKLRAVPKLHNGETFLLFEPLAVSGKEEKPALVTLVEFNGEFCPLPPDVGITGTFVGLPLQLNTASQLLSFTPAITLLFQEANLPGDKLLYGKNEVYFQAHATDLLLLTPAAVNHAPWGAH